MENHPQQQKKMITLSLKPRIIGRLLFLMYILCSVLLFISTAQAKETRPASLLLYSGNVQGETEPCG